MKNHSGLPHVSPLHKSAKIVLLTLLVLFVSFACSKQKPDLVKNFSDPAKIPTLRTLDVTTLISDSGITRYRIVAKEWLMYEQAKEPYWYFPSGIYVESFDTVFNAASYIKGDTAIYYKSKMLWELKGNVLMANIKKERFSTEQLFWDQRDKKIYSDKFIHIEKEDRIIEGIGFESNEPMTQYVIHQVQGIFPMAERKPDDIPDSVRQGSQSRLNESMRLSQQKKGEGQ